MKPTLEMNSSPLTRTSRGKPTLFPMLLALPMLLTAGASEESPVDFVSPGPDYETPAKNVRKWDSPVIADLDQDGWPDLVLNDHGYSIHILWNNKGRFARPWDLVMGDLHGVTVGDYDQDGFYEMVVSRGGGSGKNARNSMIYRANKDRTFERLPDFPEPLALMRGRTVKLVDGDRDGDLDLLNFALESAEKQGASENYIYENDGQGVLKLHGTLPPIRKDGQKTLVTDFNGDGVVDLVLYGNQHVRAFQGDGKLGYTEVTDSLFPERITGVTGAVEADIDNDGDFDLYLSRGNDFKHGNTFYNPENQAWSFFAKRSPFAFEDLVIGDILELENYQSPWPDKKLYLSETGRGFEFPGETFSGADLRLVSSDTLGWPDALPENGLYLGFVGNESWRVAGTAGSPMTAVIRNVRGNPESAPTAGPADVLLENRDGRFVEITGEAGITAEEHTTAVATADFDNNGYLDFVVIKRGDLVSANESLLYLNQGNRKFVHVTDHGILSPELGAIGLGVEVLDYNRDGGMDVVLCNERGRWHLFKNGSRSRGNHLVVDLGPPLAGKPSTLGALVTVESGGTKQVRRMGNSGAMYSLSADRFVHFGLGDAEKVDRIEVRLSNGKSVEIVAPSPNTTVPVER